MRVYSFDWATKKALTVYDSQTKKVKQIPNSIEEFQKFLEKLKEPVLMLIEFGGADTFKIMAFRAGHTILQVPGKKVKDYRDSKGIIKEDSIDAKTIYDFYIENAGRGARQPVRNSGEGLPSPSQNKAGGGANDKVRNSTKSLPSSDEIKSGGSAIYSVRNSKIRLPSPAENKEGSVNKDVEKYSKWKLPPFFYLFKESDADIAEIKILFREHEDLKKDMVREKLKRKAFAMKFKIAQVADDRVKKMLFHKDAAIVAKEREVEQIKKVLEKKVKQFDIWNKYLKDIKAVGPVIAAGLIGELGGRQFENDGSLKHYAGMVKRYTKKIGHYHPIKNPDGGYSDNNNRVKAILYQFTKGVIMHKTPQWRELYDNMKVFYAEKHSDWSKGKVNNYAKKFIQTKFLKEFWHKWREEDATVIL